MLLWHMENALAPGWSTLMVSHYNSLGKWKKVKYICTCMGTGDYLRDGCWFIPPKKRYRESTESIVFCISFHWLSSKQYPSECWLSASWDLGRRRWAKGIAFRGLRWEQQVIPLRAHFLPFWCSQCAGSNSWQHPHHFHTASPCIG